MYFPLHEDGDLSLNSVLGSKFMYTIQLYHAHMLVYINGQIQNFHRKLYREYIATQRTVPQFVNSYFHAHSAGSAVPPSNTMG